MDLIIERCDTNADWTVLGNDTTTKAASTNALSPGGSMSFAKVNGAAGKVYAGIYKTLTAADSKWFTSQNFRQEDGIGMSFYLSALTDVLTAFVRIGVSSSNYLEWRFLDTAMIAGWNTLRTKLGTAYLGGTGSALWDSADLTYMAVGINFDAEDDALPGILVDSVFLTRNVQTDAM